VHFEGFGVAEFLRSVAVNDLKQSEVEIHWWLAAQTDVWKAGFESTQVHQKIEVRNTHVRNAVRLALAAFSIGVEGPRSCSRATAARTAAARGSRVASVTAKPSSSSPITRYLNQTWFRDRSRLAFA
jgi:hypothetical protein